VAVVVREEERVGEKEEKEKEMNKHWEDMDGNMAVNDNYTPTLSCSETDFPPSIQSNSLSLQPQQPPHMRIFPLLDKEVRSSSQQLKLNEIEEYKREHIRSSSSWLH
jgi:hypothetical protein